MKLIYHHRTRGEGAEGAHIRGVVNALIDMKHDVRMPSLQDAGFQVDNNDISDSRDTSRLSRIFKMIIDRTKTIPEPLFECCEMLYNFAAWMRLRNSIRSDHTDLIYERYSLFMFIGVWLAKRHQIPIILEINDSVLVPRLRTLYFQRIAKSIERWVFQNATGLVFISEYFEQLASDAYPRLAPSLVTPNAADITLFCPQDYDRDQLRAKFGVQGKTVCGYIGAFHPWHGVVDFVEKIAARIHESPDLVLLLVGDGADFDRVKALVVGAHLEDQIQLLGRVPHQDMPEYIAAMDFGVLPDANEYCSPMKLFEFMAMGCGMVVPDHSPIREVVVDRQTGWLFPAKDHETCVGLVIELSKNKNHIHEVGEESRNYIIESRQWKHNVEYMLSLIQG